MPGQPNGETVVLHVRDAFGGKYVYFTPDEARALAKDLQIYARLADRPGSVPEIHEQSPRALDMPSPQSPPAGGRGG